MQITITLDVTEENLDKLKTFCTTTNTTTEPVKKKTAKKADKKSIETISSDVPLESTEDTAKVGTEIPDKPTTISKTDVRAVALKISKAGKSEILREIFAKFGASNLKGISEDKYDDLMRELVAVNV